MGYIGEKGLIELGKQDLLCRDKISKMDFCEQCVLGKSKRVSFQTAIHKTKLPFEYIYSDLWGPSRTESHEGGKYFMSIIDEYSRRVWTFILKQKSETFSKFKDWPTLTENKMGSKLKHLRTDNGLEYLSEQLKRLCKDKGITRHMTVRRTPQQNGAAERMNKTQLERVRCLLINAGLPRSF